MLDDTFRIVRLQEGNGTWVTQATFDTRLLIGAPLELHSQSFERRFPDTRFGRTEALAWVETKLQEFATERVGKTS